MSSFFNNPSTGNSSSGQFKQQPNRGTNSSSVSFSQRRSDFMANIRRHGRFKILSQRRSDPVSVLTGTSEYDFRHLVDYPNKEKLMKFLTQVFNSVKEADPNELVLKLGEVRNMILN
jgi:hypothetical protein